MILVSGDGHVGAAPMAYRDYLPSAHHAALAKLQVESDQFVKMGVTQSRFSDKTLELIDGRHAIRDGGLDGAGDLKRRLKELDDEGVAAEILLPGHQLAVLPFFGMMNAPSAPELRTAGSHAYHRWLADQMVGCGGRFAAVADAGPCLDMEETLAELRWVAAHGFVSVSPPGSVADSRLPPIHSEYFEPFWRSCSDLGLVLTVHGYGVPQMDRSSLMASMSAAGASRPALSDEEKLEKSMIKERVADDGVLGNAIFSTRRLVWQLMLAGVFDRYPSMKVVLTEIRADWVPETLAHLDRLFATNGVTMRKSPSEYWRHHVYVVPSSPRRYEILRRREIGVDRLMFGIDYPHPEGTWPNTLDWIRATFAGVPESEARLMLGENAIECYGLDEAQLAAVAARIGPGAVELLDAPDPVEPALIEHFHLRSGYGSPAEKVDEMRLESSIVEDVGASAR
jgi:predicted TIM-barrel fold metal-dependent hydrolase